jgi:hypothetical protein
VDLQDDADVAADAAGNFVVVWHSFGQDGHSYGIFGQRFDAAGNRLGSEFQVNSYTTARQWRPSVMREPGGAFIVAWTSTNEIGQSDDVFAQQFEANGTRLGPEFRVNTYATGIQEIPALAFLGEEKFLVAWSSFGQDGDRFGVYAQRYGDFLFRDGFEGGP